MHRDKPSDYLKGRSPVFNTLANDLALFEQKIEPYINDCLGLAHGGNTEEVTARTIYEDLHFSTTGAEDTTTTTLLALRQMFLRAIATELKKGNISKVRIDIVEPDIPQSLRHLDSQSKLILGDQYYNRFNGSTETIDEKEIRQFLNIEGAILPVILARGGTISVAHLPHEPYSELWQDSDIEAFMNLYNDHGIATDFKGNKVENKCNPPGLLMSTLVNTPAWYGIAGSWFFKDGNSESQDAFALRFSASLENNGKSPRSDLAHGSLWGRSYNVPEIYRSIFDSPAKELYKPDFTDHAP